MTPERSETSLRAVDTVFRHKWKALFIPLTVLGVGLAIALFAPRTYRSEAKLALQVGRESVNIAPTAQTGQQMISLQQMGRDSEVMTAMDLLRSRGVISKVVDRVTPEYVLRGGPEPPEGSGQSTNFVAATLDATLGAAARSFIGLVKSIDPVGKHEEAIIEIEENLIVDAERDSTLIVVAFSSDSPEGARRVLEELIAVYRDEHLRVHHNEGSRGFFEEQESRFRLQLDEAMNAVRSRKNEMGVGSIAARRDNLEAQLQSVTMATYEAEAERTATAAELSDFRRQLGTLPERLVASKKSIPNEGADLLREKLYTVQVKLADLKARYNDSHPLVVSTSQQLSDARRVVEEQSELREETTDDVNPIHRQLSLSAKQSEGKIASLDARLKALRRQEATIRQELEQVNAYEVELAQLERDEAILSRKFHRYTDNLEQARIDEELQRKSISSVNVAQPPTFAEKPVSPSKVLVGLGSMVLAFAGTVATILGLERVNDRPRNESSIEKATGLPVLAAVPESAIHGRVLAD